MLDLFHFALNLHRVHLVQGEHCKRTGKAFLAELAMAYGANDRSAVETVSDRAAHATAMTYITHLFSFAWQGDELSVKDIPATSSFMSASG